MDVLERYAGIKRQIKTLELMLDEMKSEVVDLIDENGIDGVYSPEEVRGKLRPIL